MRKLLIAAAAAGLLAVAAPALAEVGGTSETGNQVNCGNNSKGTDVGPTGITIGGVSQAPPSGGTSGALVVCNDGGSAGLPQVIQGRIILSGDAGTQKGYVAADGDATNPPEAQGWARVDVSSAGPKVRCDDTEAAGSNSETPTAADGQDDCG